MIVFFRPGVARRGIPEMTRAGSAPRRDRGALDVALTRQPVSADAVQPGHLGSPHAALTGQLGAPHVVLTGQPVSLDTILTGQSGSPASEDGLPMVGRVRPWYSLSRWTMFAKTR